MDSPTNLTIAAALVALLSCTHERSREIANDPPPGHDPPAAPRLDLGPQLTPMPFAAGRYAVAIQRTQQGNHAQMRIREESTASLVLDLIAGGDATACRGWRYNMTNDGGGVHTEDRFREQRGFRGTWTLRDGVAQVELTADDTVCPMVTQYALGVPQRADKIALRCVLASPHDHPSLTASALLCEWTQAGAPTPEVDAYRVAGVVPDPWLVLGGGNGVRIKVTGRPAGADAGEPVKVSVAVAAAPLVPDEWTRSF